MKILRKILDKIEPSFQKGGNLEKLWPLYDAIDTQYSVASPNKVAPYVRDPLDSKRSMFFVVIALLPCLLYGAFNIGYIDDSSRSFLSNLIIGLEVVLPIYIVTFVSGGVVEGLIAIVRKHEINEGFLVTGLLIPLVMPPSIPLWMVAIGTSFGIVIGKEIFGGTGYNIFNPALVTRAFIFFAYPASISGDSVWIGGLDATSRATPLLSASSQQGNMDALQLLTEYSWSEMFFGYIPGSIGETSVVAILIGAIFLIITGIGSWRIMLATFIGMVVTSCLCNFFHSAIGSTNPMLSIRADYHLVMGGFAFGMVFMATDPVSAAQTNIGRWLYGFLIGFMCVIIRAVNPAYPEGMMLGILFANAFAPLIDYYVMKSHIKKRKKRFAS